MSVEIQQPEFMSQCTQSYMLKACQRAGTLKVVAISRDREIGGGALLRNEGLEVQALFRTASDRKPVGGVQVIRSRLGLGHLCRSTSSLKKKNDTVTLVRDTVRRTLLWTP